MSQRGTESQIVFRVIRIVYADGENEFLSELEITHLYLSD
jgi:hypothetical protein